MLGSLWIVVSEDCSGHTGRFYHYLQFIHNPALGAKVEFIDE
jgi:hypothetical protein